jgi:hypothetical protein
MHARPTHPIGTPQQQRRQNWSRWPLTWSIALVTGLGLVLLSPSMVQARTFQCRAGDVACLIASIKQVNSQPRSTHDIRLAAGVYTLTAVESEVKGPNGLPSITGSLTIRGAGSDLTILERQVGARSFRLIHVAGTGKLTLEGLTLHGGGNTHSSDDALFEGAGLYNDGGIVAITDTSFVNNTNRADNGGGLYNNGGTVTIMRSTFARNSGRDGGGLYNTGALTITNSTLVENLAFEGGAVLSEGMLTVINSTVARNLGDTASITSITSANPTRILNSTIVENDGFSPATIVACGGVVGFAVLQNTILAHNVCNGYPSDCFPTSLGNNLVRDPGECAISLDLLPSDQIGDPGLGAFTDDGTSGNGHYPLLHDSDAIDAANPAACPKTDQLGEKRVRTCDIGSIEFQGTAVSSQ